jgi:hypothetical protein
MEGEPLEKCKLKAWSIDEDTQKLDYLNTISETENATAFCKSVYTCLTRVVMCLLCDSVMSSWTFIMRNENLRSHNKYMQMFIVVFIITPKLKTSYMSFSGWIVKQTSVFLYYGILFSSKKGKHMI